MTSSPDVLVLREGTEGLATEPYAEALRERLLDHDVRLAHTPQEERDLAPETPVLTGVGIDGPLLERASSLRLFACAFAGTEHLPIEALADRGAIVTNAGGIHAPGIAEQVIGYALTFARDLQEGQRRQRNREWRHFQSSEFAGSTVTIVGLGSIGSAVTERLAGFDVRTIGVRYTPEKGGPTGEVYGFGEAELHDALSRTDYLVLACPLTDETRELIGAADLRTLPPNAAVINVARGPVVETEALVAALRSNGIREAALDVADPEPLPPDHPLWGLGNVLLTPHTGGHTPMHWPRLADIVAGNVGRLDDGVSAAELENVVLAPG
jgi:phosphoglycerate dehydrogenase-like enzyme